MTQSAVYPNGYGKALLKLHADMAARLDTTVAMSIASLWAQADKKQMWDLQRVLKELHRKGDATTPVHAPFSWLHANLRPLRDFLRAEVAAGNYVQVHPNGLD